MKLFHKASEGHRREEMPQVRQYRYLLRTADATAVEALTASALGELDGQDRTSILAVIQKELVAGGRLTQAHVDDMARLLISGERRRPGAVLQQLLDGPLSRLSQAAVHTPAAVALMEGYGTWNGVDPEPPTESELDSGFGKPGRGEDHYNIVKGRAEGGFST
jgi:hypothetical protein